MEHSVGIITRPFHYYKSHLLKSQERLEHHNLRGFYAPQGIPHQPEEELARLMEVAQVPTAFDLGFDMDGIRAQDAWQYVHKVGETLARYNSAISWMNEFTRAQVLAYAPPHDRFLGAELALRAKLRNPHIVPEDTENLGEALDRITKHDKDTVIYIAGDSVADAVDVLIAARAKGLASIILAQYCGPRTHSEAAALISYYEEDAGAQISFRWQDQHHLR